MAHKIIQILIPIVNKKNVYIKLLKEYLQLL